MGGDSSPYHLSATILSLETLLADMENFNVTRQEAAKDKDKDKDNNDLEAEVDDLTEKLKTAMASGEQIAISLGRCSGCREEITEASVLVGEETFHQGCFVCSECGVRLTGRYHLVNGHWSVLLSPGQGGRPT